MSYVRRGSRVRILRPATSLGSWYPTDPKLPPTPDPGAADEQVALLRRINASQAALAQNDVRAKYLQLAATLSIPLASVIWKWILGRRSAGDGGTT